jgi:hypothetical protein
MQFTPAGICTTLETIIGELETVVPDIVASVGTDPAHSNTVIAIATALTDTRSGLTALATADTQAVALPELQRIGLDFGAVFSALAVLPLPLPAAMVFRAAQFIVPSLLAMGQMVWPAVAAAPPAAPPTSPP